jgi:hypothetical protein
MGGHALRGAVSAWLALIALQTIGTAGGSGRVASFFGDVDNLVKRALNPTVPAIPDRRNATATSAGTPSTAAPSGSSVAGAHAGARINPTTGQVVGFGY